LIKEIISSPFLNSINNEAVLYYGVHVCDGLDLLEENSVNCTVTSPPYWGLRKYATTPEIWGGDVGCDHDWGLLIPPRKKGQVEQTKNSSDTSVSSSGNSTQGQHCSKCQAWQGNLGLEPQYDCNAWARKDEPCNSCYVCHMRTIFGKVHRVLKDDGILWLNIGDSYAAGGGKMDPGKHAQVGATKKGVQRRTDTRGLQVKQKNLLGIPWRVALALQSDGWFLRSDCIWHKPNGMPQSVRDRFTTNHEYFFQLTKSPRYYFDQDSVRIPHKEESVARRGRGRSQKHKWSDTVDVRPDTPQGLEKDLENSLHPLGKNRRTVMSCSLQPYSGGHFAVFPTKLIEPLIIAGCPPDGTVLDPFSGSGTTGLVSLKEGRNYVGLDLGEEYLELARHRILGLKPPQKLDPNAEDIFSFFEDAT